MFLIRAIGGEFHIAKAEAIGCQGRCDGREHARAVFAHYDHINDLADVPKHWRESIAHFFEHYKDLDEGKWVQVEGWDDAAAAKREIMESVARFQECPEKPRF